MAEKIQNQEALHIQKPLPGQSSVLAVDPGTTVYLDFPLDQAEAVFLDGDLIFRFENGEQVALDDFEQVLSSTRLFLADGTEVSGDQIMETLQPEGGEPAAGEAPPSGGAGEYGDYLGDIPDGIDRLGTLGPREFGFTPEEPDAEGVDFTESPPEAFDDFQAFQVDSIRDEGNEVVGRIFDINGQGNVLDNDVPEGVSVVGFSIAGSEFGPESLGQWISLDLDSNGVSDAQFRLSANGIYQFDYDNMDRIAEPNEALDANGNPISTLTPLGSDYEIARFSLLNLDDGDQVAFGWKPQNGTFTGVLVDGSDLIDNGGLFDVYDPDGIEFVQLGVVSGEVTWSLLDGIDIDAPLNDITVNYTIEDAIGRASSANLFLSFVDSPAPFSELLDPNPAPPPETLA